MPTQSLTWFLDVVEPTLPEAPTVVPSRENYTSTEIAEAVDKLVQGAIRRPYGILGERQTGDTFDDTMDAAAGVFILTPEAPFYVLLLGSRRLTGMVTSLITSAQDLFAAIESTGRRVRPVTNITNLGNARTALAALESASAQRDSSFSDIEDVAAFQRFDLHTQRFLDQNAKAIRVGETIVETPQQARKSLSELASILTQGLAEVQRRVGLLYSGIDDYNALNLPALLAKGVITKARSVLDERIDQMEALTPSQRLEILRETVLDILASKAVVKGFGSLTQSGEFANITGTAVTFADADHPANEAVVSADLLDPYIILPGEDQLTFTLDGGPTAVTIPIQQSFLARLEGTIAEPYVIDADNQDFDLDLHPDANLSVNLTHGTRTAAQIVSDVNAAITSHAVVAETFLSPEKFIGTVNVTGTDPNMVFTQVGGTSFVALRVTTDDAVLITAGAMVGSYFLITARTGTTISATRSGGSAVAAATGVSISVGPEGRFVRVRVADAEREQCLTDNYYIALEDSDTAGPTLGLFPGSKSTCRKTRADEVALSINSSSSASVARVARLAAEAVFEGGDVLTGRTEPSNPNRIVSTLLIAEGNVTNVGPTPARYAVSGALTAGVVVGDILTIRSSPDTGDVGLRGPITLVTDAEVRASMNGTITLASGLILEFGRDLDASVDMVVRIASPSPIAGDYRISESEAPVNASEVTIDRPLPLYYGLGNQPLTFEFQVGSLRVDFRSLSTGTDSELQVSGTAAARFFGAPPALAIGSTPWVLLATDPKTLGFGDRFEVYSGQYDVPEHSFAIIGFEQGQQLLELDGDLPNSFVELDFSRDIATPFARIRKVSRNNYDAFKVQLGLWQVLPVNEPQYVSELNRFLNPLIANENPTMSAVNTAKTHVQSLVQALGQLQTVLASYDVEVVPRVDTLVDSFLSRGSDRAVDTLLEGRFRDFFGYNSEEVSYLGNALVQLREVNRLDLPVRKTGRKEQREQELVLGQFEEPDFEFDQSDTQDIVDVDIPGQFLDAPSNSP